MNSACDTILERSELLALSAWCSRRDMSWSVATAEDHRPAMLLTPRDAGRPWQSMLLVLAAGDMRLHDEVGEVLATASDLPALLDALDGGVAEQPLRQALTFASLAAIPAATLLGYVL